MPPDGGSRVRRCYQGDSARITTRKVVIMSKQCDYPVHHHGGCMCGVTLLTRDFHIASNCWTCTTEFANDMHSYDPIQKEIMSLRVIQS